MIRMFFNGVIQKITFIHFNLIKMTNSISYSTEKIANISHSSDVFVMILSPSLSIIFLCVLFFFDVKGPTAFQKIFGWHSRLTFGHKKNSPIAFRLIPVTLFRCCLYKSHLIGLLLSFKCLFFSTSRLYICFLKSEFIYGTSSCLIVLSFNGACSSQISENNQFLDQFWSLTSSKILEIWKGMWLTCSLNTFWSKYFKFLYVTLNGIGGVCEAL